MTPSLSLIHVRQLFLVLVFTLIQFQPSRSNDLVDSVCVHNEDPAYCAQILNSDGRTPGADLLLLGAIAIDQDLVVATNVSNLIIWKNNTATDPTIKKGLGVCEVLYDVAKDNLVNASDALAGRNIGTMNTQAQLAYKNGMDCDAVFYGLDSPIKVDNRHFIDLTHAIVVISNMLSEH